MENLAGKFIVEKNGPDRKIRGLVFASLVHLDFDGTDIKLEPLEFFRWAGWKYILYFLSRE